VPGIRQKAGHRDLKKIKVVKRTFLAFWTELTGFNASLTFGGVPTPIIEEREQSISTQRHLHKGCKRSYSLTGESFR